MTKILSLSLLASLFYFSHTLEALEETSPLNLLPQESGSTATVNTSPLQTILPNFTKQISELCSLTYTADNQDETTKQLYENFFAYYLDLTEQQQREAEFYIGRCHETGIPFGKQWYLAAHYYSRSAEKGFSPAQQALSRFLEEGKAIYLPLHYLQKVATDGNQGAITALNEYSEGLYFRNDEGEIEHWEYYEEDDSDQGFLSDEEPNEE
ncbi:MAG: hypothetical protein K0M45_07750 [Candidatus Paracaedibacteraceae bacterium]|nr:hypothetical protein [Candidatus Paracaedibacteraceae bacterium]